MPHQHWEIDSGHSGIHFSVRHMTVARIRGQFTRWTGSMIQEEGGPGRASVHVLIDASSLDTGLADRDAHLKSADFLDVANFPELTFEGHVLPDPARLRITGRLDLHGHARPVTFEAASVARTMDPWGHQRAGFTALGSIDRRDFGLGWNRPLSAGGLLVGDQVEIEIDVEAVLQAEKPLAPARMTQ